MSKNYHLNKAARDGYRSYLLAYGQHKLKDAFDSAKLDPTRVARSFGLGVAPRLQKVGETPFLVASVDPVIVCGRLDHRSTFLFPLTCAEAPGDYLKSKKK